MTLHVIRRKFSGFFIGSQKTHIKSLPVHKQRCAFSFPVQFSFDQFYF